MAHNFNAIDLATCIADPNILLGKALVNSNIQDFRAALEVGARPSAFDNKHRCVFEKALQTPSCIEFIEECFKAGCSPHHINTGINKAAINYASDSQDPQNINAVLSYKGVNANFIFLGFTPLNYLAHALNPENIDNVFKCLQILLQYGASANIADMLDMTPLHYIVQNTKIEELKKFEIVKLFLAQPYLDIDTNHAGELRGILTDMYPDLKLPVKKEIKQITFDMLLTYIRMGDMEKFHQKFSHIHRKTTDKENLQLLRESIERGAHLAFDLLMDSGVNYNRVFNYKTLFEIAYVNGNWYALKKLLQKPDIKIRSYDFPLIAIVCKLNRSSSRDLLDYWECFDALVNCDKININQMDVSRSTALHYAVKYCNNKAVKELLKKGADISIKNKFNELPIDGMHPEVLEEHFNSCISSNGLRPGEEKYEILINFKNLKSTLNREEMTPIAFMAKTKDFHHLLQHPVIASYLFIKWHKLSLVFYVNFMLSLFYAISGITHIVLKFRMTHSETAIDLTASMMSLGICYLALREAIQFIMCPKRYVGSLTNYMEVLLIVISVITCTDLHLTDDIQRQVAVITILLLAIELCLLVGSLPVTSISTHMLMLEAVCKSFLKSFLFYSIFVITFTLCFYIMNDHANLTDEKAFNQFATPMVAFSKTIVMLTGEFEASEFKLDSFHLFIFLTFIFFMTIILFNLLNGLAISDTQQIKDQAKINFYICRTRLLTRYEQIFIAYGRKTKSLVKCQPFRILSRCWNYLFPDYSTGSQISILPNDDNTILLPAKESKESVERQTTTDISSNIIIALTTEDKEIKRQIMLPHYFSFIIRKYSQMDSRTVQLAMALLEPNSETTAENPLKTIEKKLEEILKRISEKQS